MAHPEAGNPQVQGLFNAMKGTRSISQFLQCRRQQMENGRPFQISNGAKELLDEVASGKVTGEEEIWSHTDLWDFQANVDGALVGFNVLREVAEARDPELAKTLDERFDALNALLATHGSLEAGFKHYDELSQDEIQALAAAVDALSEPLSKLTSTITGAG